jgi:hypothetical protein
MPMKISSLLNKKVVEISCGDYHSLALTQNGEVFSWGGGSHSYNKGQCGHGEIKDYETPKRIDFFKNKRPIKICCGGYHTMVLCEESMLYGFGKGSYGQCGYGASEDTSTPKLVKFSKKFQQYEQVATYNLNQTQNENLNETTMVQGLDNTNVYKSPLVIQEVKCGGEHTVVLSKQGRVYTFGHGYTGQLGLGNTKNFEVPMIIKSLLKKHITQIAAGWSHTLVLTSQGNLYSSGCGRYGELGLNSQENRRNFQLVIQASMLSINKIYAGGHHSWILTDNQTPERLKWEMPSPLNPGNFSPKDKSFTSSPKNNLSNTDLIKLNPNNQSFSNLNNQQKGNTTKKKELNSNIKFNLEMLNEKYQSQNLQDTKSLLQIAYSDLKMSHRFVRFSISDKSKYRDVSYKELNNMIKEYINSDPCVVLFRLQDDSEVVNLNSNIAMDALFKDLKKEFKGLNLEGNKVTYSLTIIYDVMKNNKFVNLLENIEVIKTQNNLINNPRENTNLCMYSSLNF